MPVNTSAQQVYTHANNHAGYYPGAGQVDIKLCFSPTDGKILGVQAVGTVEGIEKRVDVVSMAMQLGGTVYDLEEAELCYAPQYGSAKDAINFTGVVVFAGRFYSPGTLVCQLNACTLLTYFSGRLSMNLCLDMIL